MQLNLFLFMGGVGYSELFISLAIFSVIGFFIWRALLKRVVSKGRGSINTVAVIGGLMTAPAFIVLLGLIFFLATTWNVPSYDEQRSQHEGDSTRLSSVTFLLPDSAHPSARALLTEEFYWSPIEETSPFGNDAGSDAFYEFVEWRRDHKHESPTIYINQLVEEWGLPAFDFNTQLSDIEKLTSDVSPAFIVEADNVIIAVGFGQFVLEGTIEPELKTMTMTALQRESSPFLFRLFSPSHQQTRRQNLAKMLLALEQVN